MAAISTNILPTKIPFWVVCAVPLLFTGICLSFLISEAYGTYHRYQHGAAAIGTVQNVLDRSNSDGDWTSYYITFKTPDGQAHEITNQCQTDDDPKLYQLGQLIRVVYNPQAPAEGRIDSLREKYSSLLGLLFMTLMGLSVLVLLYPEVRRINARKVAEAREEA